MQARYISRQDPLFPSRLLDYDRMPEGIYALGELPDPSKKSLAIVGARACSPYGKAEAMRFGRELAAAGVQIISGLAYGIDAWAHRGALRGGGPTFAVTGCGVDVCYPPSHRELYREILEGKGGILSEFPMGSPPLSWHFPIRNRIISALADALLVIEAKSRSGSLITADYALEQGKVIYAIPGRNQDPLSCGCNRLISQGASIALSPDQILDDFQVCRPKGQKKSDRDDFSSRSDQSASAAGRPGLQLPESASQRAAYRRLSQCLTYEEKNLQQLLTESGLDPATLTTLLLQLCFSGFAHEEGGYYSRT